MGRGPRGNPSIEEVARALTLAVQEMEQREYLQEWYGYWCVDTGQVRGKAGVDVPTHAETVLGRREAWPLSEPLLGIPDVPVNDSDVDRLIEDAQDLVFDLIEFFTTTYRKGLTAASTITTIVGGTTQASTPSQLSSYFAGA